MDASPDGAFFLPKSILLPGLLYLFATMAAVVEQGEPEQPERKANILELAEDWERVPEVRQLVRKESSIFMSSGDAFLPKACVKDAVLNRAALTPLLKRLPDDNGRVLMVAIPDLEREPLEFAKSNLSWF